MRLHQAALIALLIAPAIVTAEEKLGTYEDRIAVEDVMARYVWAVDSLDEAGYVAVTPGWPDDPATVAEAQAHPEVFAGKGVGEIADYAESIIRR